MNKYDNGNSWNLDNESWFIKAIKTGSGILGASIIFGFIIFCFLVFV